VLETLYQLPAPDIDTTSIRELLPLLGLGRKVRALGREHMTELLRIMPMAVQELVDDTFENESLKAAIAAAGVQDIRQGPRSGGTAFVMLHHLVGAPAGAIRGRPAWRTGPNGFANLFEDAARAAGVNIRTGIQVERIVVRDDRVHGIALSDGEEITAAIVISTLDPVRTLLGLVDPVWLEPDFLNAVQNIKLRGCRATALYALDGLPDGGFGDGVVSLTPDTVSLERAYDAAKYGQVSETPHVVFTVPTLRWPDLAPQGKHVMVAHVQYVPWAGAGSQEVGAESREPRAGSREPGIGMQRELRLDTTARPVQMELPDRVTRIIDEAIPGFASRVRHQAFHTPDDLEKRFGITQGAVTHGELTLDQILFMRPVPGWGRHTTPIAGLYLGGAGTHPGPGIVGGPGWLAARRALSTK
jgi:phytoene dehydrogenase-like protein